MPYAVDTSDMAPAEGCRKRWLSHETTPDGERFYVKQRVHDPMRRCIKIIAGIIVLGLICYWIVDGNPKPSVLQAIFLLICLLVGAISTIAVILAGIPALCFSLFGKGTSSFIINPQGVVLLTSGGKLRKKLLLWENIEELWAEEGENKTNGSYSGGSQTVMVYSGGIGAVAGGMAMAAEGVGQGAANVLNEIFAQMSGTVKIRYKNRELPLAGWLSYEEAVQLLRAIEGAQHSTASSHAA